jgi:gamma-glutamyltranspeptidase
MPTLTGVHTASDYAPHKRPFHTIIPGFAYKKNESVPGGWQPWMSFGESIPWLLAESGPV